MGNTGLQLAQNCPIGPRIRIAKGPRSHLLTQKLKTTIKSSLNIWLFVSALTFSAFPYVLCSGGILRGVGWWLAAEFSGQNIRSILNVQTFQDT